MARPSVAWALRVAHATDGSLPAWRWDGEFRTFFEKSGQVFGAPCIGTRASIIIRSLDYCFATPPRYGARSGEWSPRSASMPPSGTRSGRRVSSTDI
jgi:hypothetical protein